MSLTAALGTAKSALLGNQSQVALISRNLAGANEVGYSRKTASIVTQGGATQVVVGRAADHNLHVRLLSATSSLSMSMSLAGGLDRLNATIGDTESLHSPVARLGALQAAVQQFSQAPSNDALGRVVLGQASGIAESLNDASKTVQAVRQEADSAVGMSVLRVNDLLQRMDVANNEVMRNVALGKDPSDAMDARDKIVSQISEEIGIQVVDRGRGEIALYTDSGVTLYDKSPRQVTFQSSPSIQAGVTGYNVYIDGVPVTGAGSPMPLQGGNLVGHIAIRDDIGVTYQRHLDEVARGLIDVFKEADQGGGGATLAGLFMDGVGNDVPGNPAPLGLAASISLNPLMSAQPDGGVGALRDGGLNGIAYRVNPGAPGSDAAFAGRLNDLVLGFGQERDIDPAFGFGAGKSLGGFATSSAGWLQGLRSTASNDVAYSGTVYALAFGVVSDATGVNTDEEMANMLVLEQSYSANAKVISTVMKMLEELMRLG